MGGKNDTNGANKLINDQPNTVLQWISYLILFGAMWYVLCGRPVVRVLKNRTILVPCLHMLHEHKQSTHNETFTFTA